MCVDYLEVCNNYRYVYPTIQSAEAYEVLEHYYFSELVTYSLSVCST